MHITIEIDDGEGRPRVTLSETPAAAAAAAMAPAALPAATDLGPPIDAGPAPDIFAPGAEAPPGVTDLAGDAIVSAGGAPDLS